MAESRNDALPKSFNENPPAHRLAIDQCQVDLGFTLPSDYTDYLENADGGEGFLEDGRYLVLWPVEQLVEMNAAYHVHEFAPGLLIFGSDGGDEAFAFDRRSSEMPVVTVPFIGMELSAVRILAPNFKLFLGGLG
jgi:hypothetical protein